MDGSLGVTTTVDIGCKLGRPLGNPYRGVDLRMVPTGTGGRRSDRAVPSTGGRSEVSPRADLGGLWLPTGRYVDRSRPRRPGTVGIDGTETGRSRQRGTFDQRAERRFPAGGRDGRDGEGPCGRTVDTISALAIFGDTAIAVTSPKSNGSNILYG